MPPPSKLLDGNGKPIQLGKELARGGEGAVHEIAGEPGLLAKLYLKPPSSLTVEKLTCMASRANAELDRVAAWPKSLLIEVKSRATVGFVMPRLVDYRPIQALFNPAKRQREFPRADWSFIAHVGRNVAAAFEEIHKIGCVVGDINESNLLVSAKGFIGIIDCDSFQIQTAGKTFFCEVGIAHYTPPELQGANFRGVIRTPNHDRFGLAVVLFQLLFMGRHPYAGRFLGSGDLPFEKAIQEFRYAYSDPKLTSMDRPPHIIGADDVTPELAKLFDRAFLKGSDRDSARPTASDWLAALERFSAALIACPKDPGHRYPSHLSSCPWCRLIDGRGPNYFLGVSAVAIIFTLDRNEWQRWSAILAGLKSFETPYHRNNYLPSRKIVPQPLPKKFTQPPVQKEPPPAQVPKGAWLPIYLCFGLFLTGGLTGVVGCFVSTTALILGVMFAIVFAIVPMVYVMRSSQWEDWRRYVIELRQSRLDWHAATQKFVAEFAEYRRKKLREHSEAQNRLQTLENQREAVLKTHRKQVSAQLDLGKRRLDEASGLEKSYQTEQLRLEQQMMELSKVQYLKGIDLADADIPQIRDGRKQVLSSYGVTTAFDVEEDVILSIRGFGPGLTENLLRWRKQCEANFRFDPKTGVPESDRRILAAKFVQLQRQIWADLQAIQQAVEGMQTTAKTQLDLIDIELRREVPLFVQAEADALAVT